MSGITGTQMEVLYVLPATVTKNTYTTEAVMSAVSGTTPGCRLQGNYFNNDNPNPLNRCLYLHARGTIATTSAATLAINLGFDPTFNTKANAIAVLAATAPVAAITAGFTLDIYYTCTAFIGTQMTLQVNGTWVMEGSASGGVGVATSLRTSFSGTISGAAADPRVDNYIELFGTWSASAAGNTTSIQQMFLFGLN